MLRRLLFIVGVLMLLSALPAGRSYAATTVPSDLPYYKRAHPVYNRHVAELQQQLITLGYKPGTPDGLFGGQTEAAVKQFQRTHKLAVDGIVGRKTWIAVMESAPDGNRKLPPAQQPPDARITKLVSFTHTPTGISGLRPDNWAVYGDKTGLLLTADEGKTSSLIGMFIPNDRVRADDVKAMMQAMLAKLKQDKRFEAVKVLEERSYTDGGASLLMTGTIAPHDSTPALPFVMYMRVKVSPKGLLFAVAGVTADDYPAEAKLFRQMGDSLHLQ